MSWRAFRSHLSSGLFDGRTNTRARYITVYALAKIPSTLGRRTQGPIRVSRFVNPPQNSGMRTIGAPPSGHCRWATRNPQSCEIVRRKKAKLIHEGAVTPFGAQCAHANLIAHPFPPQGLGVNAEPIADGWRDLRGKTAKSGVWPKKSRQSSGSLRTGMGRRHRQDTQGSGGFTGQYGPV